MRGIAMLFLALVTTGAWAQDYTKLYPDGPALQKGKAAAARGKYDTAHKFYLDAAAYGSKEAQKLIGLQYLDGQGVDADAALAYAWVKLANSAGDDMRIKKAYVELADALDDGVKTEAEKHYSKLAKDYSDEKALKKRKSWVRRELRGSGSSRMSPMEQIQIQIDGMYYRVSVREYKEAVESYADDFEEAIKG